MFYHYQDEDVVNGKHWTIGMLINPSENSYPACTVAELGVMLSQEPFAVPYKYGKVDTASDTYCCVQFETWCKPGIYRCVIRDSENNRNLYETNGYRTEAQARASMLIYLLESNLITPEQVNERLK